MSLKEYFSTVDGTGFLATADDQGRVDVAIYSRPHVISDDEVAFISAESLTHSNLETNPHAAYLFLEKGGPKKYAGTRLYLTKVREEDDQEKIRELSRRSYTDDRPRYLVFFKVDRQREVTGIEPPTFP